jgi:hypothetical protein
VLSEARAFEGLGTHHHCDFPLLITMITHWTADYPLLIVNCVSPGRKCHQKCERNLAQIQCVHVDWLSGLKWTETVGWQFEWYLEISHWFPLFFVYFWYRSFSTIYASAVQSDGNMIVSTNRGHPAASESWWHNPNFPNTYWNSINFPSKVSHSEANSGAAPTPSTCSINWSSWKGVGWQRIWPSSRWRPV